MDVFLHAYVCSSQNYFIDFHGSFDEQQLFPVKFARFHNFSDFNLFREILESGHVQQIVKHAMLTEGMNLDKSVGYVF
jgi:hypothetical protein